MRVTVSAAGRFHAFNLVEQLYRRGHLQRFITTTLNDKRLPNRRLPESIRNDNKFLDRVLQIPLPEYLAYGIRKLPIDDAQALSYFIKDNYYDRNAVKHITNGDFFVGWASQSLFQLREAKARGARTIIERGSTHITEQFRLINEERNAFGVSSPIRSRWEGLLEEKQLKEYHETDFIMVPSEFAKQSFLAKGFGSERVLKVRYGVDLDLFYPAPPTKHELPVLLYVGAIGFQKGLPYLLEAAQILKSKGKKFRLKLIGRFEKDFEEWLGGTNLRSEIDEHISFVQNNELVNHFHSADVFVMPSIQEGLALVIAEAMASGLPIVATENTGASEFIGASECGLIVPPSNSKALASAVGSFLDDLAHARAMGEQAASLSKTFGWDAYGDAIEKTYKSILDSAKSDEKESGEEVASFYDEYWDREHGWTPTHSFTTEQLNLHFAKAFQKDDSVLDVGCGDASNYQSWLVKQVRDLKAIDISKVGIAKACKMGLDAQVHDLSKTFPYSDNTFDGAVCIEVLEHLYDPKFTVSEIFRVLKPGGLFIASVPNNGYFRERLKGLTRAELSTSISDFSNEWKGAHIRFYSLQSFRRMLEVCGFGIESVRSNGDSSIFDGIDAFGGYATQQVSSLIRRKLPRPLRMAFLEKIWPSVFAPHIIVWARKPTGTQNAEKEGL